MSIRKGSHYRNVLRFGFIYAVRVHIKCKSQRHHSYLDCLGTIVFLTEKRRLAAYRYMYRETGNTRLTKTACVASCKVYLALFDRRNHVVYSWPGSVDIHIVSLIGSYRAAWILTSRNLSEKPLGSLKSYESKTSLRLIWKTALAWAKLTTPSSCNRDVKIYT